MNLAQKGSFSTDIITVRLDDSLGIIDCCVLCNKMINFKHSLHGKYVLGCEDYTTTNRPKLVKLINLGKR